MRGLLIKDFINLKRYNKTILIILAVFIVNAVMTKDATMLSGMVVLLCSMMSITSFSYDDLAKWDKFALSMPISRKDVVTSKYLLAAILTIIGSTIAFFINLILAFFIKKEIVFGELFLTCLALAGVGMVFACILFPFIYKFGVEKARLIIFAIALIPMGLSFLLVQSNIPKPSDELLNMFVYDLLEMLPFLSPIILCIIIFVSYQISKSIYQKKEL